MNSPALETLPVLVLDCQTTGANPDRGHLLEVGWATVIAEEFRARDEFHPSAHLVELPEGVHIPRPIQRLTGITEENLSDAISPASVFWKLAKMAADLALRAGRNKCPTVIHYAKFETPFLSRLHADHAPKDPLPFDIICTHEMAVRLFPELPRRGLHALSGYIGRPLGELKRSAEHVLATAYLWAHFVETLRKRYDITSLQDLRSWLLEPPDRPKGGRSYPMPESSRRSLPSGPGVYRMLRRNGDVLYVGKARSLRTRVNSYFRKRARHPEHILEMLTQAEDISTRMTGSALQAALVEADEIKRRQPPYNRALRDRNRSLCYAVKDFSDVSSDPVSSFTVGTFPSDRIPTALIDIRMAVEGGTLAGRLDSVMGLSPEFAPGPEVLSEGVELFKATHAVDLNTGSLRQAFMRIGRRLWEERQCALEEPDDEASLSCDETGGEDEEEEWEWDPERVAGMMEGILVHAGHMIRRARWMCLLQEATIAWETERVSDLRHALVFEKGEPAEYRILDRNQSVPVPPGCHRSLASRRNLFDLATYDRLRVLTTELRRLVKEGRWVAIRISPSVTLSRSSIARVLHWI